MIRRISISLAFASLLPHPAIAATEHLGKGFQCQFQTDLNQSVPVTVWYGRINKAPDSVPQIQDPEKLFAIAGLQVGARMMVHASDEWPKKFALNYFEERGKGRPSALFIVYDHSNNGESFLADISQFSLDVDQADPNKVVATKRYRGLCKLIPQVTFTEFRKGLLQ